MGKNCLEQSLQNKLIAQLYLGQKTHPSVGYQRGYQFHHHHIFLLNHHHRVLEETEATLHSPSRQIPMSKQYVQLIFWFTWKITTTDRESEVLPCLVCYLCSTIWECKIIRTYLGQTWSLPFSGKINSILPIFSN